MPLFDRAGLKGGGQTAVAQGLHKGPPQKNSNSFFVGASDLYILPSGVTIIFGPPANIL